MADLNPTQRLDPVTYLYHAHTAFGDGTLRLEILGMKPPKAYEQTQVTQAAPGRNQWSLGDSYVSAPVKETVLDVSTCDLRESITLCEAL